MKKKKRKSIFTILLFPFILIYKVIVYVLVGISYCKDGVLVLLYRNNVDHMSGIEFEVYVAGLLEENGFEHVETTKASNDYGIDLLAMKKKTLYAFQCKKYSHKVGVEAVRQAETGCVYYDYDIPVVITNNTFSSQAVKLAETLEVELWDGSTLQILQKHSRLIKKRKRVVYTCIIITITCLWLLLK